MFGGTLTLITLKTEYLQSKNPYHEREYKTATKHRTHGTNRNSISSSTPFTVFSTRFTFLHR